MQAGLSTPIVITIIVCLMLCGLVLIITPLRGIKILMLWPKFLEKFLKFNFSQKWDEILNLLERNPSAYQLKYKSQLDILRITGGMALLIAFATLCGLLQRFSQ